MATNWLMIAGGVGTVVGAAIAFVSTQLTARAGRRHASEEAEKRRLYEAAEAAKQRDHETRLDAWREHRIPVAAFVKANERAAWLEEVSGIFSSVKGEVHDEVRELVVSGTEFAVAAGDRRPNPKRIASEMGGLRE